MKPRAVAAFVLLMAGAVRVAAAADDVTVRTSVDRTAMWVADRVTFTIELTCRNGVDVLADDLSRDKLKLEGLEVVGGDTDRRSAPNGATVYEFRYVLTTYRVDVPTLSISPLRVRYAVRRSGQRLEDATPAGEIVVPGATIALRSVLNDEAADAGIRSDKPAPARPARSAVMQSIGLALVIVSVVPALLAIGAVVRRTRRPRVRRSARAVRHDERASLDAVRDMDVDAIEGRRAVFARLDALVRAHLRDVCGIPGASLTPHEIPFALAGKPTKVPSELVASVLSTCELALYAPPHAMPSASVCRETIDNVEEIVGAAGRRATLA